MRRRCAALLLGWVVVAAGEDASADASPTGTRADGPRADRATDDVLVLRAERALEDLARRTAALLGRRAEGAVLLGEPLFPPLDDATGALGPGEVALVRAPKGVRLVLAQPGSGRLAATALRLEGLEEAAAARAVALAVESLRDPMPEAASEEVPSEEVPRPSVADDGGLGAPGVSSVPRVSLSGSKPAEREMARPIFFLRLMVGVSPVHGDPLLGPGAGLGLCGGPHCVVIEGDLSVIPLERSGQTGVVVRYRSFNGGVRFQFRPWVWDDASLGFTFGLLTRMGRASIVDRDESQLVSNLAARGTLEVGYRLAGPLELMFEGGVDGAISRARFLREGRDVFLEDRWTPWLVAGLRVRP